jgi:hypothetical protein
VDLIKALVTKQYFLVQYRINKSMARADRL